MACPTIAGHAVAVQPGFFESRSGGYPARLTTDPAPRVEVRMSRAPAMPYSVSWLDHLIDWVDRLPGPAWLAYLVAVAASAAAFVGVQLVAADGSSVAVSFSAFLAAQPILILGISHAIRNSARRSMRQFRPLLPWGDEAVAVAEFEVANGPAGIGLTAAVALAIVIPPLMLGIPGAGLEERFVGLGFATGPASVVVTWLLAAALSAAIGGFFVHFVHQLQVIARLGTAVPKLDLYRLEPVYAFSSTTALGAILLTIDNYLWYVAQPALLNDPFSLVMGGVSGTIALAAFAWPLWSAHRLLAGEKHRALAANGAAFRALTEQLHVEVAGGRLEHMDRVNQAMASLDLERQGLDRIPTWPWHAETLRAILAAIFLPLVVWLAQYLLGKAIGA